MEPAAQREGMGEYMQLPMLEVAHEAVVHVLFDRHASRRLGSRAMRMQQLWFDRFFFRGNSTACLAVASRRTRCGMLLIFSS